MNNLNYICIALLLMVVAQPTSQRLKDIRKEFLSPESKNIMVASHRGAHNEAPEKSLASFQHAIDLGVDVIELDIRHTSDSVLVLMHDRTVDRTTNGKGKVAEMSFEEIRKLRLKHQGNLTDEKVPTFEEALLLTKNKIMIDLDIKTFVIKAIIKAVRKTKSEKKVIFFVYNPYQAKMIKKEDPAFMTMIRTDNEPQIDSVFMVSKTEAIHIDPSHNTPTAVQKIKGNGARIWINSLGITDNLLAKGNVAELEKLLSSGANMIQTDQPELLLKYLREHNLHQ